MGMIKRRMVENNSDMDSPGYQALPGQFDENQTFMDSLRGRIDRLATALQEKEQERRDAVQEVDQLKGQMADVQAENEALKNEGQSNVQMRAMKDTEARLNSQIQDLQINAVHYTAQIQALRNNEARHSAQIQALRNNEARYNAKIGQLEIELENFKATDLYLKRQLEYQKQLVADLRATQGRMVVHGDTQSGSSSTIKHPMDLAWKTAIVPAGSSATNHLAATSYPYQPQAHKTPPRPAPGSHRAHTPHRSGNWNDNTTASQPYRMPGNRNAVKFSGYGTNVPLDISFNREDHQGRTARPYPSTSRVNHETSRPTTPPLALPPNENVRQFLSRQHTPAVHHDQQHMQVVPHPSEYTSQDATSGMEALTVHQDNTEHQPRLNDFEAAYTEVLDLMNQWITRYAREPHHNDRIPDDLRHCIFRGSPNSYSVYTFFRDSKMRSLVVRRYLLEIATNNVWKSNEVVKDFASTPQHMQALDRVQSGLSGVSTGLSKSALYTLQATTIEAMKKHPFFNEYTERKSTAAALTIWVKISELFVNDGDAARADFKWLWKKVFNVGIKMLCTTCAYRFDFPKASNSSFWNPESMVNVDPLVEGSPEELRQKDSKMTLCLTPVVMATQMISDAISPHMVSKAEVLLHT